MTKRLNKVPPMNIFFPTDEIGTFASMRSLLLLSIYETHLFQDYNNVINVAKIMRLKRR